MLGRAGGFAGLAGPVAFGSVRCGRWRRALSVCLSSPFLLTGSLPPIPHPPPSTSPRCLAQNLIFRFLQNKSKIKIWLFNNNDLSIEGQIIGFDEYMNLVLDNAEEVHAKKKTRKALGRILLKGENITLMQVAEGGASMSE